MELNDTYTYPPSVHQHIAERINEKENFQAIDAYYYLPDGITVYTDVASGNMFAMVHSPVPYTTSLFYGMWTVTVFIVIYQKNPKVDKVASRYYKQVGTRALEPEEVAYFEGLRNGVSNV